MTRTLHTICCCVCSSVWGRLLLVFTTTVGGKYCTLTVTGKEGHGGGHIYCVSPPPLTGIIPKTTYLIKLLSVVVVPHQTGKLLPPPNDQGHMGCGGGMALLNSFQKSEAVSF